MTRREFSSALGVAAASSQAVCRALDFRGQPLAVEQLRRAYLCDLRLRPLAVAPQAAPGELRFEPPTQPFRIACPLEVPGFGHIIVYADNRGRGYTAPSFAQPLDLNRAFAEDRLAAAEALSLPSARLQKARALLGKGALFESLSESLYAGEELAVERARQRIARNGPRPGFLFGCNSFGFPRLGQPYAERFQAVFNYATLPFYLGPTERVEGQPNYSNVEKILGWLGGTRILAKGHPLVWFYPQTTPAWLRNLPYEEVKRRCVRYVHQSVSRFRNRIHAWDVINEAHVQNVLGFDNQQQIDITAAAARAAREADPTCFRVINNCCTWSEYMRQPKPGQRSVYDYLAAVKDAGIEFEAIGLQYYYSGRDLLEIERSIETFQGFGKRVHITELGLPSSSEEIRNQFGQSTRYPWHGDHWTEGAQADWVEGFYTIAYSKLWIDAITWWDLNDPAFIPHGGLLRPDLEPKESYTRLEKLIRGWQTA